MTMGPSVVHHAHVGAARASRTSGTADAHRDAPVQPPPPSSGVRAPEASLILPRDFVFGVATSAHQVEGGLTSNNWADWERRVRPDGSAMVPPSERCGPATDSWNRFEEDLALMRWLGVDCYRFSVEWSRVEPRRGYVDDAALSRYRDWCCELRTAGVRPMVTLFHFTEPIWASDMGGFAEPPVVDAWVAFVERVVARMGDLVDDWVTVNEPVGYVVQGWLRGVWPPGLADPGLAGRVLENLLLAHAAAYRVIHVAASGRSAAAERECRVGMAHHVVPFRPARRANLGDQMLARALDRAYNHAVPTALTTGHLRLRLPGLWRHVHHPELVATQDFLGVNHYFPLVARLRLRAVRGLDELDVGPSAHGVVDDLGFDLDDASMGEALVAMARYGLPIVVTEHGVCDGEEPDLRRRRGLTDALVTIARLLHEGVDIRGYLHWSLVDNFEWAFGWTAHFGLFRLDRPGLARTPRGSARLYRDLIAWHREAGPARTGS